MSSNMHGKNFKVVIRVRPPLQRELDKGFLNVVKIDDTSRHITVAENFNSDGSSDGYNTHVFTFDHVYDMNSAQEDVYNTTARDAVTSTLKGYNATMIAYGQTGTGKTYAMEGFTSDKERGIIPRATEEIFNFIQTRGNPTTKFLVRASYLQIYNEVVSDLLKPERTNLVIREDKKRGVFVDGLSEWVVRSPAEIYGLMERGAQQRATGSTKMNELSSRSHAVFIIIAEQSETFIINERGQSIGIEDYKRILHSQGKFDGEIRQSFKIGKLNLVDLAGSERVRFSGATGIRLEESKKINQSLSCLGFVIAALTDPRGRQHIPYRNSKLTRLLEDSLGGNCKTTMMAMISPAAESFQESISTLKFAHRAKNIKNEAHVNEDIDQRALLRKYERELKKLRSELDKKTKNMVDKQRLLELEDQKKRAEEDKMAAITALEKRSREFMSEKQQKRKLEERITMMQSQLLIGGEKVEDTPEFKNLLKQEYQRVHKEYMDKMAELERERQNIEEDKAQVDRYKQLLLKQRDIMIALTARLNERDESILGLQEELDAYDRHQRMLEDELDRKTSALRDIQQATNDSDSPDKRSIINDIIGNLVLDERNDISKVPSPPEDEEDEPSIHLFSRVNSHNELVFGPHGSGPTGRHQQYQQQQQQQQRVEQSGGIFEQMRQELHRVSDENRMLTQELQRTRQELANNSQHQSANAVQQYEDENDPSFQVMKQQMISLKHQCITKEKEKQALKTILETKVKSMVDNIYQNVNGLSNNQNTDSILHTKSIIIALSQLVNASVAALSFSQRQEGNMDDTAVEASTRQHHVANGGGSQHQFSNGSVHGFR